MLANILFAALLAFQASAVIKPISVGRDGLTFDPNTTTAAIGDIIEFRFWARNHSVVAGHFTQGCVPASRGGFFSGFIPTAAGARNVRTSSPYPIGKTVLTPTSGHRLPRHHQQHGPHRLLLLAEHGLTLQERHVRDHQRRHGQGDRQLQDSGGQCVDGGVAARRVWRCAGSESGTAELVDDFDVDFHRDCDVDVDADWHGDWDSDWDGDCHRERHDSSDDYCYGRGGGKGGFVRCCGWGACGGACDGLSLLRGDLGWIRGSGLVLCLSSLLGAEGEQRKRLEGCTNADVEVSSWMHFPAMEDCNGYLDLHGGFLMQLGTSEAWDINEGFQG